MMPPLNAAQWQEDLEHLANGLRRMHRNLFHSVSAEAFDRAVRALHGRIPSLEDHEVTVELARLVALVGDGHTVLRLIDIPWFRRFPVVLERYSDGLFVRRIASEFADAAGARLLAINATPADEATVAVRPLISGDNEMGIAATAPALLAVPEVLHACGLATDPERASFTVQPRGGAPITLGLRSVTTLPTGMVDASDAADTPVPLWLRRTNENWCEHLPEHHALYVGYNTVRNGTDELLSAFFERTLTFIEENAIDRLILDIRHNHGGNNALNPPLIHGLIRCDRINRWGGLFAIIGRHTFSAAMNLAVDLERHTRVLFVGEPTGARPNHYGENGSSILPHSGLHISVSTLWWQYSHPLDDRPWIAPDIPVRLSSADYAANHDPLVAAALHHQPGSLQPPDYPDRLMALLRRDDLRSTDGS